MCQRRPWTVASDNSHLSSAVSQFLGERRQLPLESFAAPLKVEDEQTHRQNRTNDLHRFLSPVGSIAGLLAKNLPNEPLRAALSSPGRGGGSTRKPEKPSEIDKTSLTFGRTGAEASLAFCTASAENVNGDGLLDQVCHFFTELTGFQAGDTEGILKGQTVSGISILGRPMT